MKFTDLNPTLLIVLILTSVSLVGCAPPPAGTVTAVPLPTATAVSTSMPLATPIKGKPNTEPVEALPENILLTLRREGGFAGRRDLWTLYKAGRIETNKGETHQIGEAAVAALLVDLTASGFFELQDDYRNPNCADCFEYTLSVNANGKRKTVRTNDAGKMPDALRQIIDRVTSEVGNVK